MRNILFHVTRNVPRETLRSSLVATVPMSSRTPSVSEGEDLGRSRTSNVHFPIQNRPKISRMISLCEIAPVSNPSAFDAR